MQKSLVNVSVRYNPNKVSLMRLILFYALKYNAIMLRIIFKIIKLENIVLSASSHLRFFPLKTVC